MRCFKGWRQWSSVLDLFKRAVADELELLQVEATRVNARPGPT